MTSIPLFQDSINSIVKHFIILFKGLDEFSVVRFARCANIDPATQRSLKIVNPAKRLRMKLFLIVGNNNRVMVDQKDKGKPPEGNSPYLRKGILSALTSWILTCFPE